VVGRKVGEELGRADEGIKLGAAVGSNDGTREGANVG